MFKVGDNIRITGCLNKGSSGFIKWIVEGFDYNLYAVILDNKFWPNRLYSFRDEEMELL